MKIKDEREELEKMINQSSEKIGNDPKDIPEMGMEPAFDTDFDKVQKECTRKARKMIGHATGFMLSDELVKDNPYLRNKMDVDVISLAGMLYQLEVSKTMQTALMEEARAGALHPRMFEVFGSLTKTDKGTISLGTKELINQTKRLKAARNEQNIQDIEIEK